LSLSFPFNELKKTAGDQSEEEALEAELGEVLEIQPSWQRGGRTASSPRGGVSVHPQTDAAKLYKFSPQVLGCLHHRSQGNLRYPRNTMNLFEEDEVRCSGMAKSSIMC